MYYYRMSTKMNSHKSKILNKFQIEFIIHYNIFNFWSSHVSNHVSRDSKEQFDIQLFRVGCSVQFFTESN